MSLQERDKAVIWHPFTAFKYAPAPIPIVKGEGVELIDEAGNRYIDAISSWWVNIHGHAHPYIAKKIYEQARTLEQVIFAGFTHEPAVQLAERLLPYLPGHFSKIFYSDNGSTSTEVAIKMALQYWWNKDKMPDAGFQMPVSGIGYPASGIRRSASRKKVLAFKDSYHGDTFGAMSVSDRGIFTKAFHEHLFDVVFIDAPLRENIQASKDIIQQHAGEIAAFIYEPLVQGAGGMKMYEAALLDELLAFVKSHEILCIADEVMTGFYRTGKFFASDYTNEKPDIICLSKGLTGGTMALGVTAVTHKIVDAFVSDDKMKTFFHGHSFTANPLACTAALASLDLLEKETCLQSIQHIVELHKQFVTQLTTHDSRLTIKNLRQTGTLLAFEVVQGKDEYLNNISATITQKAMQRGVYIRPLGNTLYLMPPYCILSQQLQRVYEVILLVLKELREVAARS